MTLNMHPSIRKEHTSEHLQSCSFSLHKILILMLRSVKKKRNENSVCGFWVGSSSSRIRNILTDIDQEDILCISSCAKYFFRC